MIKTQSIDLSEDRLLAMAADYVEEHNYIGALRMLNKNAELNGNAEDSYMLYAETFDDMGLYEKSVNGWFKYIDYSFGYPDCDFSEAYEGLAVNYLNMGEEEVAAFYYNKLLIETSAELSPENRQEIINNFIVTRKPTLKIAYPPRLADVSGEMEKGVNLMRAGEYESAKAEFSKVGEGNKSYLAARNYIAMCDIIADKCDEAEQECNAVLKKYPDNIQALTTLAAVKNQQKKTEESRTLAQKLLSVGATSTEDLYKIATVCCENNMHEEAYNLFCKIEQELTYDSSVLYFKAVSAYNSGRKRESLDAFDTIQTIYWDAVTAKYYADFVRSHLKEGDEDYKTNPLSYFYRLPQEERESNIEILSAFVRLSDKHAKSISDEIDITDCIRWCFDEGGEHGSYELKMLGAACAVKTAYCDDLLRDVLLDAFQPDSLKMQTIGFIAERNEDSSYGVVVCHIYRRLDIPALKVGRAKRKYFVKAYAMTVARFALVDPDYVYALNAAAGNLYKSLSEGGRLDGAKDIPVLAAAIYLKSGIGEGNTAPEAACAFFNADESKLNILLGE
ncbi:MAG TPA: hypothetical protein IAB94_05315 [Candidatus Coproplasma avicola]|uniref:Tetratricopeptide repeat protein n=1 Tax=Candidatus Coproplasma avicola TaxID=2840744 RepID=A0A9D1J9G3_9FIRM|nr:hypothetical protein [Candidatus Coproplasma avicola]